jgi:hypothetical protein
MKHRYASWASTAVAAAVIAMIGCDSGTDESSGDSPINGTAGTGGIGGMMAPGGTGGTGGAAGTIAPGGAGGTGGVAGSVSPGGTGGAGTGGAGGTGGTGGDPMAGTGGMGGAGGDPMGGTGGMMASGSCEPATSVDEDGPFTPTRLEDGGESGSSWVFYPEDLGRNGMLHPIFNWGPGAGTAPSNYIDHLNRLASHGFVVISQPSSGSGTTEKASLDWLIAENDRADSVFYQKLDTTKVGAGGHSLGALTTMAMAGDERLNLYVLVCGGCMSGRGGCGAADIHGPTVILGGDTDTGTPNFEGDYEEITSPVVFVTKTGTGHIPCARNNLAPWVAFMRWQFCGEEEWKPRFFDGGEYCSNPWEACKSKGW